MPKMIQQADELEAFCLSCPVPEEVTTLLEHMGMRLDFQMDAFLPRSYSGLAQLPAQFHYEEASVMYNQKSSPNPPFPPLPSRKR
jgi:hypothetical protein